MNFSHNPQMFAEYPSSPFVAMDNNYVNTFVKGCYNGDNHFSNGMENFNLASMVPPEEFEGSLRGCHVDEYNWTIANNLADSLWNMDESWQFRQLQERDT